jgi:hypothetical protein
MIAAMAMMGVAVMVVIVAIGVIMAMIVIMLMGVRHGRLRLERRLNMRHSRTEPPQHVFKNMIAPDTNTITGNLHIGVAISEMPGDANELARRGCRHLGQRLRQPGNQHDPAIVQHKPIAVVECHGLVEIDQYARSILASEYDTPALAIVRVESHPIDDGRGVETAGGHDGGNAVHGPVSHTGHGRRRRRR